MTSDTTSTRTAYLIEVHDNGDDLDSIEVLATSMDDAREQAANEVDNAYVEIYGPGVLEWMLVRITDTTTGELINVAASDLLGEVEA